MTLVQLAECARAAEQGNAQLAARAVIKTCDVNLLHSIKGFAKMADEDVSDFMDRHDQCYQIKVPRLGAFWLAPLSAWSQLPSGAVVMSPRGLKALAVAVVREIGKENRS